MSCASFRELRTISRVLGDFIGWSKKQARLAEASSKSTGVEVSSQKPSLMCPGETPLHAYKRQLLNLLAYHQALLGPQGQSDKDMVPRCLYLRCQGCSRLPLYQNPGYQADQWSSQSVNKDESLQGKTRKLILPGKHRVSSSSFQADVSEQISLASRKLRYFQHEVHDDELPLP